VSALDPAFVLKPGGRLSPLAGLDPALAWRHVTAAVARDSLDLEAQVRRILLACAHPALQPRLFGALIDLFLALGSHGEALRRELTERCAPLLEAEDAQYLMRHLAGGLHVGQPLPAGSDAMADPCIAGTAALVAQQRVALDERSTLEEATELLEHGDLEGARALLEAAVLLDPDDAALAGELQMIYRHSRDEAAEQAMVQRLRARHGRLSAPWSSHDA